MAKIAVITGDKSHFSVVKFAVNSAKSFGVYAEVIVNRSWSN